MHASSDLDAMTRLYELGNRCVDPSVTHQDWLNAMVETAIALSGADKGNLQLFDSESGALMIAAHRG